MLPPRESFSPESIGAIGLVVHRLALATGGEVIGRPVDAPYRDVAFHPAPSGLGVSAARRYAAGVARVLRRLRPRLVEVHNRPELALLLAREWPRVLLVLHNDPQGMRGARTARQRSELARRLAGIVTVSQFLSRRLGLPDGHRVHVLPNPVDLPPLVPTERQKLILFTGRVVADKGADAFVAACATALPALPGWTAEMIGADRFSLHSPETPFLATLRPKAKAAGVTMLGYRPHEETMARLQLAAIAAVPSRWDEPFGMAALEAMAHGTALICSQRGGLPEVAGDAALYADPDTPGSLAAAMTSLAQDGERRAALASAGRHRALRFETATIARQLVSLRADILAGSMPMQLTEPTSVDIVTPP